MKPSENEKPLNAGGPLGVSNQSTKQNLRNNFTSPCDIVEAFRSHISSEYGLDLLGDLIADGKFHYAATGEDKKGHKPFRYCVHVDDPQNVYFNDLKRGFHGTWFMRGLEPLDPVERERRRR